MNQKSKDKKWALITGASSGIGKDFAYQLAAKGHDLILVARRLERLQEIQTDIQKKFGVEVQNIQADLSLRESPQKVFADATADGKDIRVLINNAGGGHYGPLLDHTLDKYVSNIELNVTALTQLSYLFTKHMLSHEKTSYITNIASVASYLSFAEFSVYAGTKHYVRALTEALSHEFKKSNIHFTCVSPGGTRTEFLENAGQELKKGSDWAMMESKDVVSIALRGMERKKVNVVTGFMNKSLTIFMKFIPHNVKMAIGTKAMKDSVDYKPVVVVR